MTSPAHPTHRISSPAQLLDAIPYLLGFHPADSVVLVGVRAGVLGATARLDLADCGQPDLVEHSVSTLYRSGADRLFVTVFDDDCEPRPAGDAARFQVAPWRAAVLAVVDAAEAVGAEIAEALLVRRGRWWSFFCEGAGCCPPEGNPLVGSPSPFAAASTFNGVVALPSRAALAETLEPRPERERAALEPLLAEAEHGAVAAVLADRRAQHDRGLVRELMAFARESTTAAWPPPDDATVARLAAALTSIEVRDQIWLAVDARRIDGRPLWTSLARRCPTPYDAAPLFLLAWANWRAGNGALAAMAVERVVASDPDYTAADLLQAALAGGIDPRSFPRLTDAGFQPGVRARRRPGRRGVAARKPR